MSGGGEPAFPDDGLDASFLQIVEHGNNATAANSSNTMGNSNSGKRKHDDDVDDEVNVRKRIAFQSALVEQLSKIDPEKLLTIYEFLEDHDKDPIVNEYVNKLLKLKFYPSKPAMEDINNFDKVKVTCELSSSCHEEVVELLMAFFQCRYSRNNLIDATVNRCAVIPVHAKLTIPYFTKTPARSLRKATQLKTSLAIQIQGLGVETTEFISELLFISAAYKIHEEVSKSITDESTIVQEVQTQFEIHFLKSEMEYVRQANIKKIDWQSYRSKIKHVEPRWRSMGLQPPVSIYNRFANKIKTRIQHDEEKFDPFSVKTEFMSFLVEGDRMIEKLKNKSNPSNAVSSSATSHAPQPSTSTSTSHQTFPPANKHFPQQVRVQNRGKFNRQKDNHFRRPHHNLTENGQPNQQHFNNFNNINSGRGRGVRRGGPSNRYDKPKNGDNYGNSMRYSTRNPPPPAKTPFEHTPKPQGQGLQEKRSPLLTTPFTNFSSSLHRLQ
ncbi:unnamed protein product [Orchesella dallaii]|uniref:Uncharacterized protein n=1 Tax=Orchesella dallaii TaxID=48710 RepID=A0ABP1QJG3_9HEXA